MIGRFVVGATSDRQSLLLSRKLLWQDLSVRGFSVDQEIVRHPANGGPCQVNEDVACICDEGL